MAASVAPAPPKSPKKKVAKAAERTDSPARSVASGQNGDGFESPYIKELQKYEHLTASISFFLGWYSRADQFATETFAM